MPENAWGWLIVTYLFLAGAGAGAFLAATGSRFLAPTWSSTLQKSGALISGPLVAIGTLFLVVDLEAGLWEPWRQIYFLSNMRSMIAWGVLILSIFIPISLLYAIAVNEFGGLTARVKKYENVLGYVGSFLAICTAGYTGVLIAVMNGMPFWNTPVLPILFLVSAVSTGFAAALICSHLMDSKSVGVMTNFALVHIVLLVAEFFILMLYLFMSLTKSVEAATSVSMLVTGIFSPYFWMLVVLLGILVPLITGIAEYFEYGHIPKAVIIGSEVLVLVGGMSLRALIVLSGTAPLIL